MIVGMDFGTTNSGMSVFDGERLQLLALDPGNANPRVLRTALYVTNEQNMIIGRQAIDQYFADNLDRPVQMQRVWVGEIEVIADEVFYIQDAYVWTDVLSPGRLFLSIKSSLRDKDYLGTVIGSHFYALESLIAIYLYSVRARAEELLGRPVRRVVLGRPVRFSFDPDQDRLAQKRLLAAAFRAGYEEVYFQFEPIAAAYHYASQQAQAENVLVFDFGGGTLDITVMRVGAGPEGQHEVLATGGIPIAGDVFDQKLIRAKLPPHFGEGSSYGPPQKPLPVPLWIYEAFANWQSMLDLQTPNGRQLLQEIALTARKPREINAFINLVSSNYGRKMFDIVERAKRDLSDRIGTMIKLKTTGVNVRELVTRSEFETIIALETKTIAAHLDETLAASGLTVRQIDAVIRTGGSAQIPVFQQLLANKFGADKIKAVDTFSSVTAGLGVYAHRISTGSIVARPFTSADVIARTATQDGQVQAVNLDVVKRRIQAQRRRNAAPEVKAAAVLITLNEQGVLATQRLAALPAGPEGVAVTIPTSVRQPSLLAAPTDTLLLTTSHYRFLRITVSQLLDLGELDLSLNDVHPLNSPEKVKSLDIWSALKGEERLIIVTMPGFARKYVLAALRDRIDGPVPLTLDEVLPGWPFRTLGAPAGADLFLVTAGGRGQRLPIKAIPLRGDQALKKDRDDPLAAALILSGAEELLLLNAAGYGRRLARADISETGRANQKGRVLTSRGDLVGGIVLLPNQSVFALTGKRLLPFDPTALPLSGGTAMERAVKLEKDERVTALLTAAGT